MEWKIGEIRQVDGEWYQCVSSSDCPKCDLKHIACCRFKFPCESLRRNDCEEVIFKKLEKEGKPYVGNNGTFQSYKLVMPIYGVIPDQIIGFTTTEVVIKQTKEDMEEQHSTENYPKEGEVATRIANKVGEDIREQLEKNLNKEDMEEKKIQLSEEEYDYVKNEIEHHKLPGKLKLDVYEDKVTEDIMKLFSVETNYSNSENIEKNLKPFDLEAAKAGKPVCTRDGRKARIICFDRDWDMHIVALIADPTGETVHYYLSNGKVDFDKQNDEDLMMLPEKKEGWVNVYKKSIYKTKEDAFNRRDKENYLMTIKVGWEE